MTTLLRRIADNRRANSLANTLRLRRFTLFKALIAPLDRPLRVIDIGGTERFWERMGMIDDEDIEVVLLNLHAVPFQHKRFTSAAGDARDLRQFKDNAFDIVFSNSVIEHVGGFEDQRRMANEVHRLAPRYFLQTPNRYFPIEPHFLFPCFQFLPLALRVWLVMHFDIGNYTKFADRREALEAVSTIRLLTRKELQELFPDAIIYEERFYGLVKSYIVYSGWERLRD